MTATDRPLRVVHVIGGGDIGGVMTHLVPLLVSLRERGLDLQLLCLGGGGFAEEASRRGIPTQVLPMTGPFDPRVLPRLRRELGRGSWDIVHTHGSRANLPVRVMRSPHPRPGAAPCPRYFTTVHSDLLLDYRSRVRASLYGVLDRATLSAVDQMVCVSEDLRARLLRRGYPASKLVVIRPALELDPRRPLPEERAAACRPSAGGQVQDLPGKADLPEAMAAIDAPEARWVGTVARLVGVKDIDLMVRSFREVASAMPAARLAIIGDGPERPALAKTAAELELEGRVAFTGRVPTIWPALRRLSVYWVTSISEGLPLSIMEAMSTGLPVVATAVGGIPEVIEEGVSGFMVSRADREAGRVDMAQCVLRLLRDPQLALAMGQAGAARVAEDFVPAAAARRYELAYRRAVAVIR